MISGLNTIPISSSQRDFFFFFFHSYPKNAYEFLISRLARPFLEGNCLYFCRMPDCSCYLGQKLEGTKRESWLNISYQVAVLRVSSYIVRSWMYCVPSAFGAECSLSWSGVRGKGRDDTGYWVGNSGSTLLPESLYLLSSSRHPRELCVFQADIH